MDIKHSFLKSFECFHRRILDFGSINSLVQILLTFTCPGVPDIYQGCELWDLSFVDPDNRRPVNYDQRLQFLEGLNGQEENENFFQSIWKDRNNGQVKLWLTRKLANLRRQETEFFEQAEYVPLQINGVCSD